MLGHLWAVFSQKTGQLNWKTAHKSPAPHFSIDLFEPSTQSPGCGFPIAKIGVLFSLATGAAVALVIDVLNTHDIKLARKLYKFLNPGDVLLGDRAFCAYADLVFVKNREADAVFRKHQGRKQEMRRGKIIGSHDKQVIWHLPKTCPKVLSRMALR